MNAEHNYIEGIDQECPQNWPPATSITNSKSFLLPFPLCDFLSGHSPLLRQQELKTKRNQAYRIVQPISSPFVFSPCIKLLFPLCILLSTYHYPVFLIFLSRVVLNQCSLPLPLWSIPPPSFARLAQPRSSANMIRPTWASLPSPPSKNRKSHKTVYSPSPPFYSGLILLSPAPCLYMVFPCATYVLCYVAFFRYIYIDKIQSVSVQYLVLKHCFFFSIILWLFVFLFCFLLLIFNCVLFE